MRIIVNAAFDTRQTVGISTYIRHIIPALAEYCELMILTPDPAFFCRWGEVIPLPQYTRYNLRRTVWTMLRLNSLLPDDGQSLLFSPTPVIPLSPKIPAIAVVHDLIPLVIRREIVQKEKLFFFLGLQSLRSAAAIVTVSANTKKDLVRLNLLPEKNIYVIWNGPGVQPSSTACDFARQFTPFILYVGSHSRHKNLKRLIAAFAGLSRNPDLKLVLAGSGSTRQLDNTCAVIRRFQLLDRVILLNKVDELQLSSLYQNCLLFVFPSLYEGFGLPVVEAMLHGAPLVISGTSSLPEIAGDAALYFNPYSVSDITEKIKLLLDDPALRQTLIRKGLERSTLFSWKKSAEKIYSIARRLLGQTVPVTVDHRSTKSQNHPQQNEGTVLPC